MTAITSLTATEIAQKIKASELSAREVVDAHIQRIEQVNTRLNAVVIPLFDQARKEADAADTAQRQGDVLGPLHGVPITIKEQFLVKDTATTFGVLNLKNHRATEDGPLVKRLREAGAIILGKTNTGQLLMYIESDNPVYGRTNNPWSLERSPGGSSGGEAAIIAAGGSPLGLGADFGGSIREPSHFCAIQGLKPTAWRLTKFDIRPGIFSGGQEGIVPQPGPMARSVADLALAMSILAAPGLERIDSSVPPVPWPTFDKVAMRGMRIAMYTDDSYFTASPAIRRVVTEAAEALRAAGAEVESWMPPDVNEAMRLFFSIASADAANALKRALGPDKPMPQIRAILQGSSIPKPLRRFVAAIMQIAGQTRMSRIARQTGARSAESYWKLIEDLGIYRLRFYKALDSGRFDAIICPPTSLPAVLHGSTTTLLDFDSYARLYNVLGMPAGVVAAGCVRAGEESDRSPNKDRVERTAEEVEMGSTGLPVGVQVVARHWREDIVLAVMSALEGHFRTQPDYPGQPPI
jgi:fatty acid amide hydrolase